MTVSRCTTKIGRRSDGLHALITGDSTQWPAITQGVFWKGTEAPIVSSIPIPDFMARSESYVEWLGQNKLIVVDSPQTSMRTTELSYPALAVTNQWTWGDAASRWGASWMTKEGGVACCVWAEADKAVNNQLWLDLSYRNPDWPFIQPTWYQRFKLAGLVNHLNAPVPHQLAMCQGTDGLLYVFCTRDSAGIISMTRFRKGAGASWELVDHAQAIAPVSGEMPTITAMPDKYNNRIILAYQSPDWKQLCPQGRLSSWVIVAAVYPDKKFQVLGKGDWWSNHQAVPRFIPWPRRDGIYLITDKINELDCVDSLLPAYFNYSKPDKIYPDAALNSYKVEAFGDDGWFVSRDNDNDVTLTKIRFKPELSVKNAGTNVVVSWDESQANDQLYTSLNEKDFTAGQIGQSPVTVTKDVKSKWFKVKQSP